MRLNRLENLRDYLWAAVPILLVVAVWTYGYFLLHTISEFDERCNHGFEYDGAPLAEIRHSYLPMEYACVFEDGTVREAVPGELDVVLFGSLGGAAASAVVAVRISRRLDREATPSDPLAR